MNKMLGTKTFVSMSLLSLAVATTATLAACEDAPRSTPKPKEVALETAPSSKPQTPPSISPAAPAPAPLPAPPLTPGTVAETKPAPVEDESPADDVTRVRELLEQGKVAKALVLSKAAVREQPKRSAAWNVLGRAQLRSGHRQDAIEAFERAVELNPKNAFAYNNLGLAQIYEGQFEEAAASLETAVELAPVTAYMWNNLGMAYERLDRLDDARDAYEKAADMDSELASASLTRLEGVKSATATAKADDVFSDGALVIGKTDGTKAIAR